MNSIVRNNVLLTYIILYKYTMWCMFLIIILFSFYFSAKPEGKSAAFAYWPFECQWLDYSSHIFTFAIMWNACVKQKQALTSERV